MERKLMNGCRTAWYARTSAGADSIDTQVSLLSERIEADGCVGERSLCFVDDGASGSVVGPALERLCELAASGGIDRLYVLGPDRLGRGHAQQGALREQLQGCGVELVFLQGRLGSGAE